MQELQKLPDLRGLKIPGAEAHISRNSLLLQRLLKLLRPAGIRPEQNHHIPILYRPQRTGLLVRHLKALIQCTDFGSNCPGFKAAHRLSAFLLLRKNQIFRVIPGVFRVRSTLIKGSILIIDNPAKLLPHNLLKQRVDSLQNLSAAPEILMQVNPLTIGFFLRIGMVLFHEKLRSCQTEFINALLDISYHEAVISSVLFSGNCRQKIFLHQITVLVFINQNLVKALPVLLCRPGRNNLPVFSGKQNL